MTGLGKCKRVQYFGGETWQTILQTGRTHEMYVKETRFDGVNRIFMTQ
jgi:hypothetical protein